MILRIAKMPKPVRVTPNAVTKLCVKKPVLTGPGETQDRRQPTQGHNQNSAHHANRAASFWFW